MNASQGSFAEAGPRLPALFVGHGNPMNAIEDNEFSRAWIDAGRALPRPRAIVCISAHWETHGTQVTAVERPRTIHDFYGFPPELYAVQYPAPGSPALARLLQETLKPTRVELDTGWGLDHGTWSVLSRMFPLADIPVVQLSLDRDQAPAQHYALGRALRPLRERGILFVGSGNIVHNLRLVCWEERAYDWAAEFDATARRLILAGKHAELVDYARLGRAAGLSIPTNEHYLPLLYVLGLQGPGEELQFFAERVTLCSVSMRAFRIG